MASEHESNLYDDSDCIYCGSSLDDPRSLNDKVLPDISSNKSGSQLLLHQHHGNEPTSSQNLHSSYNQPLGTESSSFQDCQPQSIHQPQELSNKLESSNLQYHQTSENKLSKLQDMAIVPLHEITPSIDHTYIQSNNQPETEFGRSQDILPLSEEQPSVTKESHPLAIHVSHTLPSVNSVTRKPFWMKPLGSKSSYPGLHQLDACSSNVKQTECAVWRDGFGSEFIYRPDAKGGYFEYCGGNSEMDGLIKESLQRFESSEKYLQSLQIRARNTLLDRFLDMCMANDQNRSFHQSSSANHYDLGMLQNPYANKSESMNILVCGPLIFTTRLIKTFSRRHSVKYKSPFNLVWERTVTRCGITATVSVWQVGNLNNSVQFLKSSCVSSKTTIMYLFNLIRKESLQPILGFIRREVNPSIPVVFVGCIPESISNQAILKLTKAGFLLKAKSDLKAFLVCYVDSEEEVDSVFFTAIDASLLHTI